MMINSRKLCPPSGQRAILESEWPPSYRSLVFQPLSDSLVKVVEFSENISSFSGVFSEISVFSTFFTEFFTEVFPESFTCFQLSSMAFDSLASFPPLSMEFFLEFPRYLTTFLLGAEVVVLVLVVEGWGLLTVDDSTRMTGRKTGRKHLK